MAYKIYAALIVSVSVAVLALTVDETFARSAAAPHAVAAARHPIARHNAFFNRHHRRNNFGNGLGTVWPAFDDYSYGTTPTEPPVDLGQPVPSDIRNSQAYDIPWDWAHRYPPFVTPGEKPYVPSCPSETVKVPGHDGNEQTVNITRCY